MSIFAICNQNAIQEMSTDIEKSKSRYLILHLLCWALLIIVPLFFHSSNDDWTVVWNRYIRWLGNPVTYYSFLLELPVVSSALSAEEEGVEVVLVHQLDGDYRRHLLDGCVALVCCAMASGNQQRSTQEAFFQVSAIFLGCLVAHLDYRACRGGAHDTAVASHRGGTQGGRGRPCRGRATS